jgi:excisionase family DNA binding protein
MSTAAVPRLLTVAEAAVLLGCSVYFIYDHQRELGVVRRGRTLRFTEEGLADYIRRGGTQAYEPRRPQYRTGKSEWNRQAQIFRLRTKSKRKESHEEVATKKSDKEGKRENDEAGVVRPGHVKS